MRVGAWRRSAPAAELPQQSEAAAASEWPASVPGTALPPAPAEAQAFAPAAVGAGLGDASLRSAAAQAAAPLRAGHAAEAAATPAAALPPLGRPSGAGTLAAAATPAAIHAGDPFRLADRRLWKHGREIVLTPTERSLVELLLERRGKSVSRDEILSEVWGRYYVGDLKVVDVNIRRLRQKVEDDPSEPAIIETVWGFGYRWNRSDPE
ncbi:winged helix-turn-helix domain-containing protein [Paenibacillus albicereus]|nr:winged helix-turn-helix domain-containing protein [Paenibacillus albicereus]